MLRIDSYFLKNWILFNYFIERLKKYAFFWMKGF